MPDTLTDDENERVRAAMKRLLHERFGGNGSELSRELGLKQPSVSKFIRGLSGTSHDVATLVANAIGLPVSDLLSGRGASLTTLPDPTPTPPPAKSDTRRIATHYDDPQVEGYFSSAIRHAPEEPTGKQIVTSKVFLREKMTKMVDGIDMVDFALGVIEAVQELDKAGQLGEPDDPATHTVILAYLTAQSRARRTPREVALADARKRQLLEESANPEDDPPSAEPAKVAPRRKGGR